MSIYMNVVVFIPGSYAVTVIMIMDGVVMIIHKYRK